MTMMREYAEYFASIDHSLEKCQPLEVSQQQSNNGTGDKYLVELRARLDDIRKQSKRGNFKLTDLLKLPYQRVLKYHLLFSELLKQTDVDHAAKECIKQTRDSMLELGQYLK